VPTQQNYLEKKRELTATGDRIEEAMAAALARNTQHGRKDPQLTQCPPKAKVHPDSHKVHLLLYSRM